MKHKFILFNMYKLLQWRAQITCVYGTEFFINLILQMLGWSCYL